MYPESIEKFDMDGLEVIFEVDTMHYSAGVDMQEGQHAIAQTCHQPERDEIDLAKYQVTNLLLGVALSSPKRMPLTKVNPVTQRTIFLRVYSPSLQSQILHNPSQLNTSLATYEGCSSTLNFLFFQVEKRAVLLRYAGWQILVSLVIFRIITKIINIRTISTMEKKSLYLITGNKKKLEEFNQILGSEFDFQNENVDLPELQGDPEEVAIEKANIAYQQVKKPVLVEDTSLCFNAYKGLPGPYVKWFMKNIGPQGLAKMVEPFPDKTGYAMCIIAYKGSEQEKPRLFIGRTPGTIVQPRGSRDFGWDPVFQPEGYDLTYAELPKQVKNTISHRFRAINQMREFFRSQQ